MQVRTFQGPDTKTVLQRIKAELGPDAVILGTRYVADQDPPHCEVTAALERSQQPQGPEGQSPENAPPGWDHWHREWSEIKDHLLAFLKPQMDLSVLNPRQRLALEYLEHEEVQSEVVLRLFRQLKSDAQASVLVPLGRLVTAREWGGAYWKQRFHALAGPTGVGKTTCCLRMALALKQKKQGAQLLLVNADTGKSSGRLLLKHYAELSGLDYLEVHSPSDLTQLAREGKEYDKVIIDLPALPRDSTLEAFSGEFGLFVLQDLAIHLALAPYYGPAQMASFERQYFAPMVASLVWTKLDEACKFGALINIAAATGLPVSALSFGAGLRETLVPAQSAMLWKLIFKHETPGGEQAA